MTDALLPAVGDPAPDFSLPDDSGTTQDLGSQRGRWVVLFFYPKDFTSGCTSEVCDFRDLTPEFSALGATVWSVSVLDVGSKARFKAEHGLTFPLLADVDHAVAERYGAWREKQKDGKRSFGVGRSTFLVDPEGRIARVWPEVTVEGHAAEVLEAVRSLTAA